MTLTETTLKKGKFKLSGSVEEPTGAWLRVYEEGEDDTYAILFFANENMRIEGDKSDFPYNLRKTGSPTQEVMNIEDRMIVPYFERRDELIQEYFALDEEAQKERSDEFWKVKIPEIDQATDSLMLAFLKEYANTDYGLFMLFLQKYNHPKETIQEIYDRLTPEYRERKDAQGLAFFLATDKLSKGDPAYDFTAIGPDGDEISLFSSPKKYLLVHFTSFGCGPSTLALKDLRELYPIHSDSLEIVRFTSDVSPDLYRSIIERDQLPWNTVWDGKGKYSETLMRYGVRGYPTFALIDENREILEIFSGYGPGHIASKLKTNGITAPVPGGE